MQIVTEAIRSGKDAYMASMIADDIVRHWRNRYPREDKN